jgi:site-specific DNA recombinase
MEKTKNENRYFMYCRKSNESEDKQVQSIPDQIRELEIVAARNGLNVIETFQESRSAKAPGRAEFSKMIERINRGEADGILAWKLNRLARNPVDGGTISWFLQQGVVKHIQTHDRSYFPSDNVIVMAVELGMANQYVRDLSVDTLRGLRTRENVKGYPNGVAPMGYSNDMSREPGDRGWVIDTNCFSVVQQVLEMFATGKYSIRQLTRIANDEMGLRTPVHKRQGGKKLVLSYVAGTLLRNPVYAGFFIVGDGTRRELNKTVPRMISEETFWKTQRILQSKGRPRPSLNKDLFPYKRVCACGGCGGTITAEGKDQLICSNCRHKFAYSKKSSCPKCDMAIIDMESPKYLRYDFYHCTKRKDPLCTEGSIEEKSIDSFLSTYFKENLSISPDLANWCIKNLDQLEQASEQTDFERRVSLERTLKIKQNEDRELSLMRARGLLTDQELLQAKSHLKAEIEPLEQELEKLGGSGQEKLEEAKKAFSLATGVGKIFEVGTPNEKMEVLLETCSNLTLKSRNLSISHADLYSDIISGLKMAREVNPLFEPENTKADKDKTDVFTSVRPTLLRG